MKYSIVAGLILTATGSFNLPACAAERVFRAGAAIADITPPMGERVVGGWAPLPAIAVHDKLHARCLILDDGETQVGFVICDNLGIVREVFDKAREMIREETQVPPENLLMAATHTHSGTRSSTNRYAPILARGIADAVKQAAANLRPARIGWGSANEPSQVFNRRWHATDNEILKNPFGGIDKVRMNPPTGHASLVRPAGPIDPEVSFISVQDVDGNHIALLANYSLHYVGGVNKGEVSADYFGVFSRLIGEKLGVDPDAQPPMVGMLSNGTSGDINANDYGHRRSQRFAPYERMAKVADIIAEKVKDACDNLEYRDHVSLATARRELTLKFRKPDEDMQRYFAEILSKPADAPEYHRHERTYADRVQKLLDGPDQVSIPLQVIRIGDLAVSAIPFEVFAEIGLELKEKSPFADAFTIELANDYHGYLPTPKQHQLGGYETWMGTNRVQLDASDRITRVLLDLMEDLRTR